MALLQRWNGTYNLTAVRDPAQMLTQHLADCLARRSRPCGANACIATPSACWTWAAAAACPAW